jgi:hypothetical protein
MDDELLIAPTASPANLANREGYDENFLGPAVPLPALTRKPDTSWQKTG